MVNPDNNLCLDLFCPRSETKKNVIGEKVTIERKKSKKKAEEEKSEKEEKDKMALEMYEKWLVSTSPHTERVLSLKPLTVFCSLSLITTLTSVFQKL